MNKSLLEHYKSKDFKKSYYNISTQSLFEEKNRFSKESCLKFIQEHFDHGQKKEALVLTFRDEYEKNGKHQHTVALYLLGLHLSELFDNCLERKINKLIPTSQNWYDFKYTWFLTCLYHDTASCIEQQPAIKFLTEHQKTLDFYLGNFDIIHTPFNYVPMQRGVSLTRFSESLVKNYFYFRMDQHKLDHGILAGYIFFDKLYKNYIAKINNHICNNTACFIDGLKYRPEHIDHFAYIADAIICHNIWTATSSEAIKTYKKYGLEPLIIDSNHQSRRLDFNNYPLQFLLCLLDSIEPVKRFADEGESGVKAWDILNMISIERDGDDSIVIEWCPCLEQYKSKFERWKKGICDLTDWMAISLSKGEHNVKISINLQ